MAKGVKVQVGAPTAFRALAQVWRNLDRRSLPPLGPMKTRPSLPGWGANRSRCQRRSSMRRSPLGNATRRRLARDLGSSSISRPSSASAVKAVPPAPLARRRRRTPPLGGPPAARKATPRRVDQDPPWSRRPDALRACLAPNCPACGHRILGALPDIRAGHMNTGSSSGFGLRPQAPPGGLRPGITSPPSPAGAAPRATSTRPPPRPPALNAIRDALAGKPWLPSPSAVGGQPFTAWSVNGPGGVLARMVVPVIE